VTVWTHDHARFDRHRRTVSVFERASMVGPRIAKFSVKFD
jgi:hypothetical protein